MNIHSLKRSTAIDKNFKIIFLIMNKSAPVLGIDGCSAGWTCVFTEDQINWKIEIFQTIKKLWNAFSNAKLILIDIPIGLRDKGGIPRLCDEFARKYLTRKRSSSIFPTPCRPAIYCSSYMDANKINRKLTGKGLSKQTWNITGKIKEVDILLQNNTKSRQVFIESHPELCFSALSKDKPMQYYKKTKEGIKERLLILTSYCKFSKKIVDKGLLKFSSKELAIDDILDALILAISAAKGRSNLKYLPNEYEYDSVGLPMRMAIPASK